MAGQSRPTQASRELAQTARQHRPDPLIEGGSIRKKKKKLNLRGHEEVSDILGHFGSTSVTLIRSCRARGVGWFVCARGGQKYLFLRSLFQGSDSF